ncbi:MAG: hypothetical protein ACRELB_18870 [Polyangiaceae bacterium]
MEDQIEQLRQQLQSQIDELKQELAGRDAQLKQAQQAAAAAPAPAPAASPGAPSAADLADRVPSASSMQKSDYSERTLTIGAGELRLSLPCAPSADDPAREQSELGTLKVKTFQCDYEAASQSFTLITARFERALAPTVTDSDRNARSATIARIVARGACQGLKPSGVTCKVGTPLLVGGVASVNVRVAGAAPLSLQVEARYPYAVAAIVTSPDGPTDAASRTLASLRLPVE